MKEYKDKDFSDDECEKKLDPKEEKRLLGQTIFQSLIVYFTIITIITIIIINHI